MPDLLMRVMAEHELYLNGFKKSNIASFFKNHICYKQFKPFDNKLNVYMDLYKEYKYKHYTIIETSIASFDILIWVYK